MSFSSELSHQTQKMSFKGLLHMFATYSFAPFGFFGIFFAVFSTALLVRPFMKKKVFAYLQWWQKILMETMCKLCGFELEVVGLEHVEVGENYIIACNHRSWVDVFATVYALKNKVSFVFMVNDYLLKIPFAGRFMLMAGYIPVSKGRKKSRQQRSKKSPKRQNKVQQAAEGLEQGVSILIFPEGTRMPDHHFGPFKKGIFSIARSTQTPVVPIAVSGTGTLFPKGTPFSRPGKVRVEILPPQPAPTKEDDAKVWLADLRLKIASRYRLTPDGPPLGDNPELLAAALGESK